MTDIFVKHVINNYHHYCMHIPGEPDSKDIIIYLIQHNVISMSTIRHYVILQEFYRIQAEETFANKTQIIEHLSQEYRLHQSTVWLILKEHKRKFHAI